MKLQYVSVAALAAVSLLFSSCVYYPGDGYGTFTYSTNGYSSGVAWTSASYDANGFPIFGYSYGRPVYGYTEAGVAIFTIAALTALCFVPHWKPAPWYHGHWHYPPHIHRVAAPPHFPHGHRPGVRPHGGMNAPIHRHPERVLGPRRNHPGHQPGAHHQPNRPGAGHNINHKPGNKPGASHRPGNKPQVGRPGAQPNRPGNSWQHGARPGAGHNINHKPGNRPGAANRPGNKPQIGRPGAQPNRPAAGQQHGARPGNRPQFNGQHNRPQAARPQANAGRPQMNAGRPSMGSRPAAGRPSMGSRPSGGHSGGFRGGRGGNHGGGHRR